MKTTDRRADLALLVLRMSGLGLALAHGLGKVVRLSSGEGAGFVAGVGELGFPAPLVFAWAAALAELVGGMLVAVGLATRIAAAFGALAMAVAAFLRHHAAEVLLVHAGLSGAAPEVVESWGSPEKALLYLAILLALMLLGPGRLSLDHLVRRRRRRGA